jgi:hypothetical protein
MTREEKIKLAIEKGFTYDEVSGKIYGVKGKEITSKVTGYINIRFRNNNKIYNLKGHQFVYYIKYQKTVEQIDHKDGDRTNNKIDNLREVNNQQNQHNRVTAKGFHFDRKSKKFISKIGLNNERLYLGSFNTEEEARLAYLDAKQKYHLI